MQNIKISIIVPAYNVAEWLPRCINSVIDQTHTNWELLLIDEGSTDDTPAIIDSYAQRDCRVRAIHQKNAGLVEVREKGISLATGQYVGFIDGDDAVDPDMYERLLKNAIEYEADISHCGLKVCYADGRIEPHYGTDKLVVHNEIQAIRELLLGEQFDPSLCNKLYKREILYNSCLDKSVLNNEDLLRNFVLFKRSKTIVYHDFCGYQYWSRENSMSNDENVIKRVNSSILARKRILENSEGEEVLYALRAWLSAIINAVNELTFSDDNDAIVVCKKCRETLLHNKHRIRFLIKRQKIAAWLIVISPKLHRLIYKVYRKR